MLPDVIKKCTSDSFKHLRNEWIHYFSIKLKKMIPFLWKVKFFDSNLSPLENNPNFDIWLWVALKDHKIDFLSKFLLKKQISHIQKKMRHQSVNILKLSASQRQIKNNANLERPCTLNKTTDTTSWLYVTDGQVTPDYYLCHPI